MQVRRLMVAVGAALALLAIGWWAVFYGGVASRLGLAASDVYRESLPCLVTTTDSCAGIRMLAGLFGYPTYSPVVMWAALACLVVAIVLPAGGNRGSS